MDSIRKQTYQCAQHKQNIDYKTCQQKHSGKHVRLEKKKTFLRSQVVVATCENLSIHVAIIYYCRTQLKN